MKLTEKQLHFVNTSLIMDEKSSDDELVDYFQQLLKCSKKIALKIVAKRKAIKDNPLEVMVTNKDLR